MLQEIADITRNVLEDYLKINKVSINTNFCNPSRGYFPIDCCKGASHILGLVMSETLNMDNVNYTHGTDSELGIHGWLEYDLKIIDITIDQFDFKNKTLVIDIDKSNFHSRFKKKRRDPIKVWKHHPFREVYEAINSEIVAKLKQDN